MILEGIAEVVLPFIGRAIGYLVIEVFAHIICYLSGYVILKVVTFGKLPKEFISPKSDDKQDNYVMVVGLLFWVAVLTIGVIYLSY